jgi:transcriptional antiterminator RfaH
VEAPLFPRYLFVRADEGRSSRGVAFAPGVVHLVRFTEEPAVVPDKVIAELRTREGADGLVDLDSGQGAASRFKAGDRVCIEDGALCEQVGLFHSRVDAERVFILLTLLGRDVRTIVNARSLRVADR